MATTMVRCSIAVQPACCRRKWLPATAVTYRSFASFTPDPTNGVLPASGTIGGAGFRSGALPIIITATDTGFAYQPKGETTITGIDGLTLPVSSITHNGRGTTPFSSGAGIQETVTGLNALGALVIGLGTNDPATSDPRIGLEALANLTGAINRTTSSIANGTPDPIDPGDPFYFKIGTGGDPLVGNIADGIVAAIDGAVTSVNVNVTLRASDPRVHIDFDPGVINGLGAGDTATFDVTFTGDGRPHRFDLQFIREGTDVVLGSIPVVLGTPISGDGYEFEDCEDGEHSQEIDFGNQRIDGFVPNVAPSFTVGANQTEVEDAGVQTITIWATNISPGPPSESTQTLDFIVSNDNNALFASQPAVAPDGTLTFTPADDAFGTATVTVRIHDNGGVANGGVDASAAQVFIIDVTAVNDAPNFTAGADQTVAEGTAAQAIVGWATNISPGPANESTQLVDFIVNNDNSGLFATGPAISADGTLTYEIAAGATGISTVTVAIHDDGGITNGGIDISAEQTFTIEVTSNPVNNAPSFTKGANQTVGEDSGPQTVAAWATNISAGPAGESTQTVDFIVSNDNNALFTSQPAVAANGTLTYTPADDAFGTATVTVQIHDNGGTAGGGVDTSAAEVFIIEVTAVNDAPSFTAGADQTVTESTTQQTVLAWAANISPGPANESDQITDFVVSNDNASLFATGPAISADGTLSYEIAAGVTGAATVTVAIHDNGGIADGGIDTSAVQTFTIEANAIPEPSGTKFLVVDQSQRRTYEYDADGNAVADSRLNKEDEGPRGIASNTEGTLLWVVDKKGEVFVYDGDSNLLGSWEIQEIDKPEGITVHGDDLWIVDREQDRVFFFADGALRRRVKPSQHPASGSPAEIATPWTWSPTASKSGSSTTLVLLTRSFATVLTEHRGATGRLIPSTHAPPVSRSIRSMSITCGLSMLAQIPSINTTSASKRTAGEQTADDSFKLAPANRNPQGIADPQATLAGSEERGRSTSHKNPGQAILTWQNATDPLHVDEDGNSLSAPALPITDSVRRGGATTAPDLPSEAPLLDVELDRKITARNALAVIKSRSRRSSLTEAEFNDEALKQLTDDDKNALLESRSDRCDELFTELAAARESYARAGGNGPTSRECMGCSECVTSELLFFSLQKIQRHVLPA